MNTSTMDSNVAMAGLFIVTHLAAFDGGGDLTVNFAFPTIRNSVNATPRRYKITFLPGLSVPASPSRIRDSF